MCGRYTVTNPGSLADEAETLGFDPKLVETLPEEVLEPRYNIAPTQPIAVFRRRTRRSGEELKELLALRWGLIPRWSKKQPDRPLINARVETVTEKPSFKSSLRWRRCLVPADGFYEWQRQNGRRRKGVPPSHFRMRGGQPMAFAGLWDRWKGESGEERIESCCFLTTEANDVVAELHDRMPVILRPDQFGVWLDPSIEDTDALVEMLQPLDPALMERLEVSALVNSVQNDGPELLAPPEPRDPEPENLSLF